MTAVQGVDQAFWYIIGFSLFLLTGITVVMVYFVIRYRRSIHPVSSDIRDNYGLEIVWTVIPTLIALSMFYIGWKSYVGLRTVPDDAMEVEVLAQKYSWIFVYDNDKETENELVVPLGRAVRLNVTSLDVLHSFYLPAFRIKVDAVRGMDTYAWFRADELGEYDIECTEYCGVSHSAMVATLRIVPQEEFDGWVEEP
ncbi:cytochrome c oxidase subunit II [Desulforhopalus singaporensis]|uniref:Cytochrome c oxidase subunit 2 n=1 Tax=Desulforhopalus singaporensis TaxID=91360 RepID=A0A1H0UAJ8_9BACT|nr:cytochrome c oxidase subunit II [Desulforhopalus singaporensis]SDP63060.1 cytochrome c oxidase subunit 2 [Desulforhopalus singaporensis]